MGVASRCQLQVPDRGCDGQRPTVDRTDPLLGRLAAEADAFIQSGEVAQRRSEVKERTAGGPAELVHTITIDPKDEPQLVWSSGEVRVSATRSTHVPGHVSYRVDTPAGSMVVGGDAVNDVLAPPRKYSTSDQVERLAKGADIIVHSAIHPIMGPGMGNDIYRVPHSRRWTVSRSSAAL
jgi:ribonuclease Z